MEDAAVKVLLVDDDEDDFIITRDLISQHNGRYKLDWASNYDAGLAAVRRGEHDVCLLDYYLGERTGLDLLRETRQFTRMPMILLTGQGDQQVDMEALKAGASEYLVKDQLTADTLDRAIRYAIEAKHNEERLRRDRDLISRIMETSPVGILMTDRQGRVTFANQRAEQLLGLTEDAVAAGTTSVWDWHWTDHDGRQIAFQQPPLKQVLDTGQSLQDVRHSVETPDGRRRVLSTNAAPLFDATGKVDGMVVTVEDITERLTMEAQLRQSQKMESIGQLAAGIAHDINNVLTVIQGHVGLLLLNTPPDAASVNSLKQISAAAERAANFVRHLLTFSRKQTTHTQILDLNAVLRNLEDMLSRLLGEDIALETRYSPDVPKIESDAGLIEQVVMNLAVNARDAMPNGGKLVLATSSITTDDAYVRRHPDAKVGQFVCLTVSDTGCGMEPRVMERIFEPFFTTKEAGKGTGLGLATVYGIVKQHSGWIEVQSEIGAGSTFRIFLPAAVQNGESAANAILPQSMSLHGRHETILIVEDEPRVRELSKNVLQLHHYRVLTAACGSEALRVWDECNGQIDLLFTDMIMPGGMTGSELAAELKKRKPELKLVYTSGYSAELAGKDFKESGIPFLAKPYNPIELARLIRECLDNPLQCKTATLTKVPFASGCDTSPATIAAGCAAGS